MALTFVPAVSAPSGAEGGLLFACRRTEVVVRELTGGAELPTVGELAVGELHYLGALAGEPCFAAAADGDADGLVLRGLRGLYGALPDELWALAGRAVQIVEWERTHRHCGACGAATQPLAGERARRCPDCRQLAYPRLSPAVIVLVRKGRDLLLARGRHFPEPMYSCVAGFVDPGESLEEAVVRELREEVGIEAENVRYFGSQPWPFPHSLMIGFTADWAAGELRIDEEELVDAAWFAPDALPLVPPALSIARALIDSAS